MIGRGTADDGDTSCNSLYTLSEDLVHWYNKSMYSSLGSYSDRMATSRQPTGTRYLPFPLLLEPGMSQRSGTQTQGQRGQSTHTHQNTHTHTHTHLQLSTAEYGAHTGTANNRTSSENGEPVSESSKREEESYTTGVHTSHLHQRLMYQQHTFLASSSCSKFSSATRAFFSSSSDSSPFAAASPSCCVQSERQLLTICYY